MAEAREKVEAILTNLSVPGRTLWDKKEIDEIKDQLLDVWAILNAQEVEVAL